jgi:hypothetical protein
VLLHSKLSRAAPEAPSCSSCSSCLILLPSSYSIVRWVAWLPQQQEREHACACLCVRQVLVATAPMCWGMTAAAQQVVILGTQFYDSTGATGGADYPVTDLLQMMGRASRPDLDTTGRCARAVAPVSLDPPGDLFAHVQLCCAVCVVTWQGSPSGRGQVSRSAMRARAASAGLKRSCALFMSS